jgi:hypothetical protein
MIIGITGKAGAGKDTIADYLVSNHNYTKIALADPIKRLVKDVFVLSDKEVYDRVEREKPMTQWNNWSVRKLLQYIGTEAIRKNIDDYVWVKHLWFTIEPKLKENPDLNFVIPDIRFPNELDYLNRNVPPRTFSTGETYGQFESWKVIRKGCDGNVGIQGHESEAYDLKTDYNIYNDSSIEYLHDQIGLLLHGG